jgi:hypothetical protein
LLLRAVWNIEEGNSSRSRYQASVHNLTWETGEAREREREKKSTIMLTIKEIVKQIASEKERG